MRWTEAKIDALLARKPDCNNGSVQQACSHIQIHARDWAMLKRYVGDCRDALARPAP